MKHCCRNCHFLAREDVFEPGQRFTNTWSKEEREKGQIVKPEKLASAPKCWRGVWDTGVSPALNSVLEEIIDKDRKKDGCSFIEHSEGMLFQAALELHSARNEKRDRKQGIFFGVAGIVIGLASTVLGLIVSEGFREVVKEIIDGLGMYIPIYYT